MTMPSMRDIGQYLEAHRQALLIGLAILELLVLLVVFLRWFNRRYGLRGTARRLGRAVAAVTRDAVGPIIRAVRFRRGVQLIAARIGEADPSALARESLASARASLPDRADCWPYVLLLGPDHITVGLAGPGQLPAPDPEVSPWSTRDERSWTAARPLPPREEPHPEDSTWGEPGFESLPVLVGVSDDDLVLLDLARSPGIISVHGAPGPAARLVAAMARQLVTAADEGVIDRLVVAMDLPAVDSTSLQDALAIVGRRGGRTVLVCERPDPDAAGRLAALISADPGLLVLVAGYVPGPRWRLRVSTAGRLEAPELALDVDTASLGHGLQLASMQPPDPGPLATPPTPARPAWADEESVPSPVVLPPTVPPPAGPPKVPAALAPATSADLIEPPVESPPMARSDAATALAGDR